MGDFCDVAEKTVGGSFEVIEPKGGFCHLRELSSPVMREVVTFADI